MPGGFEGWLQREIPLGRMQTGDDVANAIAFLMSDDGNYITGEALNTQRRPNDGLTRRIASTSVT